MSESRHLRSVSDLYAADEIEVLLLEEIRDLEPPPAAYSRPEDIQDFEIAGSRTGGRISSQSSDLDSPGIHSTVHSWDSHANYHDNYGHGDHRHGSSANAMAWPRTSHLIFYCDIQGHLKTATGLVRLLLLLCSAACLVALCSSGTAKVSLFMLPSVGRLRFMIFVAVFCLLITALLLFLDISHVVYFFPFNWSRLNAWIFMGLGVSFLGSSLLLFQSTWEYYGGGWVPKRTRFQLLISSGLGFLCALLSLLLSWLNGRHGSSCQGPQPEDDQTQQLYKPVDSSSSGATLKEGSRKQPPPWVAKNSRRLQRGTSVDSGGGRPRKDHWASAREHFLGSTQLEEEPEEHQAQPQPQRTTAPSVSKPKTTSPPSAGTTTTTTTRKKAAPPKKLALQEAVTQATAAAGTSTGSKTGGKRPAGAKGEGGAGGGKRAPGTTRTSVTRSEIQEYWMQGYEHVQRTDKTTANIEQWQSAAMRSLEEKKANDARWSELWRQQKEQAHHVQQQQRDASMSRSTSSSAAAPGATATTPSASTSAAATQSQPKPCSSKTLEPLSQLA